MDVILYIAIFLAGMSVGVVICGLLSSSRRDDDMREFQDIMKEHDDSIHSNLLHDFRVDCNYSKGFIISCINKRFNRKDESR